MWQRIVGPLKNETNYSKTTMTIFQQRWRAKRLSRGYHGDQILEQKFERWFMPNSLPVIQNRTPPSSLLVGRAVAGRAKEGGRAELHWQRRQREKLSRTPIGTLLYREVERRLDTLVFRACFATSIYQARTLVIGGKVKVNGLVVNNANVRLNPGDLFTVDPKAMPMLTKRVADETRARNQAKNASSAREASAAVAEARAEATAKILDQATEKDAAANTAEESKSEEATGEKTGEEAAAPAESKKTSAKQSPPEQTAWFTLPAYAAPHLFIPAYLETNFNTCSAVYVRHPTARPGYSEIPSPYDADGDVMNMAWEWFKKKGKPLCLGSDMSLPQLTHFFYSLFLQLLTWNVRGTGCPTLRGPFGDESRG